MGKKGGGSKKGTTNKITQQQLRRSQNMPLVSNFCGCLGHVRNAIEKQVFEHVILEKINQDGGYVKIIVGNDLSNGRSFTGFKGKDWNISIKILSLNRYDKFVSFVEKYYSFLHENGGRNVWKKGAGGGSSGVSSVGSVSSPVSTSSTARGGRRYSRGSRGRGRARGRARARGRGRVQQSARSASGGGSLDEQIQQIQQKYDELLRNRDSERDGTLRKLADLRKKAEELVKAIGKLEEEINRKKSTPQSTTTYTPSSQSTTSQQRTTSQPVQRSQPTQQKTVSQQKITAPVSSAPPSSVPQRSVCDEDCKKLLSQFSTSLQFVQKSIKEMASDYLVIYQPRTSGDIKLVACQFIKYSTANYIQAEGEKWENKTLSFERFPKFLEFVKKTYTEIHWEYLSDRSGTKERTFVSLRKSPEERNLPF